jgi:subtilase family serine protease
VEGDHELVIEVDSGETISEISEQNNRATIHFSIAGGQSDTPLLDLDIGIIVLLVGLMAVVVGMILLIRMKGKSGKQ